MECSNCGNDTFDIEQIDVKEDKENITKGRGYFNLFRCRNCGHSCDDIESPR